MQEQADTAISKGGSQCSLWAGHIHLSLISWHRAEGGPGEHSLNTAPRWAECCALGLATLSIIIIF